MTGLEWAELPFTTFDKFLKPLVLLTFFVRSVDGLSYLITDNCQNNGQITDKRKPLIAHAIRAASRCAKILSFTVDFSSYINDGDKHKCYSLYAFKSRGDIPIASVIFLIASYTLTLAIG